MSSSLKHSGSTGHLLYGGTGHLVDDCGEVPSSCPEGLADSYAIADLTGLTHCSECTYTCDSYENWDGTLTKQPAGEPCEWWAQNANGYGNGSGECLHIDGVKLVGTAVYLQTIGSSAWWELYIHCYVDSIVWGGWKSTGSTPVGTYQRLSGCSDVPTLFIG